MDAGGNVIARHDLGVLGERASYAYGLDESGAAVGTSDDCAFLWESGQMVGLNGLVAPGSAWRLQGAAAINERGQIVGWGSLLGVPRAFLLTPSCVADFNGDGVVDSRDVLAFLNLGTAGC